MNNSTIALILNGIVGRLDTITDSCEDEDILYGLNNLSEDINLIILETLKGKIYKENTFR